MSFSSEVKREIIDISEFDDCCKRAFLYGVLQALGSVVLTNEGQKIVVKSFNQDLIKRVLSLVRKFYPFTSFGMSYSDSDQIQRRRYYYLTIAGETNKIIDDFHLMPFSRFSLREGLIKKDCCKASFIRGLFLSKGSISDPRKNAYHMELSLSSMELAKLVSEILSKHEITAKVLERNDAYVLYIKKSEEISRMLALIGASSGVFYFEDSRIRRDVSNMANRMANCDIANLKKTSKTAYIQKLAIQKIRDNNQFDKLTLRLQTMVLLREEYPDACYEELSEYSDKLFGHTLSKSGISHCMSDVVNFSKELEIKKSNSKD